MANIKVTQEWIDKGEMHMCDGCPVALAIDEVLAEPYTASVSSSVCGIYEGKQTGETHRIDLVLPVSVAEFIASFDNGKKPQPFEFELDIPQEFLA